MHRASFLFRALPALATLLVGAALPAWGVPVTALYVVIVPAVEPAQAAQEAMRVELVRLTGRRSAASDPALATLVDNARQYVQLERATTSGQVQVLFDEPALAAALAATGVVLWDADRPLLWISLPSMDAPSDQALRTRLAQAAQERGLPILIATAPAAPSAPASAPASAPTAGPAGAATVTAAAAPPSPMSVASALEAAHADGASAALVATLVPGQPGTLQWTLTAAEGGGGVWVGSPELAVDQSADTLAAVAEAINQSPVAQYACHISGVTDLGTLVSVLDAIHAAPAVTRVDLSEVDGDQLTLQLGARSNSNQLERALSSAHLQPTGTGADGLLEFRYVDSR